MKLRDRSFTLAALGCALACQQEPEWGGAETLSPLPEVPADPTNAWADDEGAAELGEKFFHEESWAGKALQKTEHFNGEEPMALSCATCHDPCDTFDDGRDVAQGAKVVAANTPTLVNSSFYEWGGWTGKFDSQWRTPLFVFEAEGVFASSRRKVVEVVREFHAKQYEDVFGQDPRVESVNRVFVNVGKAIAAYTRTIVWRDSPFDRFVAGDDSDFSDSAKRGLELFLGEAGCVSCHGGPHFSDGKFHNIGIPGDQKGRQEQLDVLTTNDWNVASEWSDDRIYGAAKLAKLEEENAEAAEGAFRTKSLRNVARTAPYMHSGQLETLWDVLESYNHGNDSPTVGKKDPLIRPLHLSDEQLHDLETFLVTLSADPPTSDPPTCPQ